MSENLAFKHDRLRDAALAATLRIGRMEPTVIVDCVPLLLREGTILAFLVAGVSLRTLLACSCNEAIEGLVMTILNQSFLFVETVGALHVGGVSAAELCRPRCWSDLRLFNLRLLFFLLFSTSLCTSVNHIADSVDSWTLWRWLIFCQVIRHIYFLVSNMEDVTVPQFQWLNWWSVATWQWLFQSIVCE